jgi:hypothetical protein
MGDYGTHALEINPSSENHNAVVVEDGGKFETYRSSGNGKGVFVVSNGVFRIFQPSIYNEHYSESSGTTTIYDTTNVPFAGFSAVDIAEGSTLTFSTRNRVFWEEGHFYNESGDRVVQLADVPITGRNASIALDNANVNKFGVIVTCGLNTATGNASVVAPAEGEGETTLYFANGANWAGTVVAGNVALTNVTDSAAKATATFGTLNLAADFPVRVWKSNGTITADTLNLGDVVNNGGKVMPTKMSDGEDFARGDAFVLGKIAKGATLPRIGLGWVARTSEIDGDDSNDNLVLRFGAGMQIIVR